jgi:hypothetical protein
MERDSYTDDEIRNFLSLKKVAVIGISRSESKAAHFVPKYLSENGFDIIPVNPNSNEILSKKCYKEITEVEGEIDIVDVFRPSEDVLSFVRDAIKKNPKVIWLQEGIHNEEAENLAREHGIDVVFNRCMLAEHRRLM